MNKKNFFTYFILFLILILVISILGTAGLVILYRNTVNKPNPPITKPPITVPAGDFVQFSSEQEFYSYLSDNQTTRNYSYGLGMGDIMLKDSASESAPTNSLDVQSPNPDRYSQTNVQVQGIDEPDIVKTNGTEIFFSPDSYYFYDYREAVAPESYALENTTKVISAFPIDKLDNIASIDQNGQLLLIDDTLIVIGYDSIYSYDVTDPANPKQLWQYTLQDYNSSFYQTRSFNGNLYVITQTNLYDSPACPIPLLKGNTNDYSVVCDSIYHPTQPIDASVTYTVLQLNPQSGTIEKNISMLGSYDSSVIYMSENNIYVAYTISGDIVSFFHNFILENSDLFSDSMIVKVTKLNSYDISDSAKLLELQTIMDQYMAGLDQDDKLKLENDLQNSVDGYLKDHKRELESTMINQIDLNNFEIQSTGSVPGSLLNSFSMDEYNGNLRVATTTANNIWGLPINISNTESINDVYILDKSLKISGSVLDMGAGERIYSVRFLGEKGYVVTFRETDPFYVLDLSSASNPRKVGELKIPGYSSYLHPISDELILGIGKEDQNVKISLFDVSDPTKPSEISKYSLSEYWSDILTTHHAFLLDDKHQVFFVPGSAGGYIFDYSQDTIKLVKAIDSIAAQRALYIDDYMYIVGQDKIVVLDESTWERAKELNLR